MTSNVVQRYQTDRLIFLLVGPSMCFLKPLMKGFHLRSNQGFLFLKYFVRGRMAENATNTTVVSFICSKKAIHPSKNPDILEKAGMPLSMAARIFPSRWGNKGELIGIYTYYVRGVAFMKVSEPMRQGPVLGESSDWELGRRGQLRAWQLAEGVQVHVVQAFEKNVHNRKPINELVRSC